jgi:transcriptional regulator with XRE-family HTH domain
MNKAAKLKLGKTIKDARNKKGFSLDTVCGKVKVCKVTLMRFERGDSVPRYDQMLKLSKSLGFQLPA